MWIIAGIITIGIGGIIFQLGKLQGLRRAEEKLNALEPLTKKED